jgi:transcriptional regulator with XRE-family HTH domain
MINNSPRAMIIKPFSANLKFLRKRKGRTQDDVASILNMKRSTLSGYENEIAEPNIEALLALSNYYKVAIDTLIKVDLTKLSEFQLSQLERGADVYIRGTNIRVLATTVNSDNEENIELVPEKAKAGYPGGFADPEYIKALPVFHFPFLSKDKKYRTFQISGDSMLPILEGSWITGEFIQDWTSLKDGQAYIILTTNEGIVFKIIENKINRDGILILHSLNTFYKPYEIHINEIREIWKFVNYISSELPEPPTNNDILMKTIEYLKTDMDLLKQQIIHQK